MASHSGRPGAISKKGTKKGAQVGTGGHSRRRLEGKGPTCAPFLVPFLRMAPGRPLCEAMVSPRFLVN